MILGTDPLTGSAFTKAWPCPSTYYQLIPNKLLECGHRPGDRDHGGGLPGPGMARARNSRQWEGVILAAASAVGAVLVLAIAASPPS